MAAHDGKMSRFFLFWMILFYDLLNDTGCFIGSWALLKKGDKPMGLRGHHLVCLRKLKLMRLGLREEDLFAAVGNAIVQWM
jgi:hypothetical protein